MRNYYLFLCQISVVDVDDAPIEADLRNLVVRLQELAKLKNKEKKDLKKDLKHLFYLEFLRVYEFLQLGLRQLQNGKKRFENINFITSF